MTVHYEDSLVTVHHGDCLDVLRTLPDESVHAVVTDPPYGIRFMGQAWDGADIETVVARGRETSPMPEGVGGPRGGYRSAAAEAGRYNQSGAANRAFQDWCESWAAECLRVLKPGGHLLASGSPRTAHRLTAGVEDAGFEIRDSIAWLYGSGFPKSLDISKAIDKAAGVPRKVVGPSEYSARRTATSLVGAPASGARGMAVKPEGERVVTAAASEEAKTWEGWGTALKPAFEPIIVARKPFAGSVTQNVLTHGTGALNIDATRLGMNETDRAAARRPLRGASPAAFDKPSGRSGDVFEPSSGGRWPANVALDEAQAAELDRQAPNTGAQRPVRGVEASAAVEGGGIYGRRERVQGPFHGDIGGASRFMYVAKAPAAERPSVDGLQHPTVKPLDLMRWLVRLVTPAGGTVLEPFAGSGTTIEACLREGFTCIAIEREESYLPLIMQRIKKDHAQSLFSDDL